ncbi:hypothetical protein M9978_22850 [Sphingomonas sp. MG17]|uniref:Uncharacterized protein n=1 Tax=Sphingomonas tagetis TaxID=2949092 RepID=A0A9X2HTK5_9SPHN|nr:DUF6771 family protein [Sphingomonas tagetis]MCP3733248.1 hypothetical protein [Sphingomonas tagetis]
MSTSSDLQQIVAAILARAPDWLKQGLLSKERKVRREAEESLATMIVAAVASSNDNDADPGGS